jgi:hypothetical protein
MAAFGKTKDDHVGVVTAEGVRPRTQGQRLTEEPDRHIIAAGTP